MEYWIELVMKYKEIIKDITDIKKERKEFIDTFISFGILRKE